MQADMRDILRVFFGRFLEAKRPRAKNLVTQNYVQESRFPQFALCGLGGFAKPEVA